MSIDKKYIEIFSNITSMAAYSCFKQVGKKNKKLADKAAVDSMRNELNKLEISGEIVIGEGELDEAPMLFIGEKLGKNIGPNFDIAVDPCDGTNFAANNLPGAISVLCITEKNNLFKAPETYMNKIASQHLPNGIIDLDFTTEKNVKNLAYFKNKDISDITVCLLDRPRHQNIINDLKKLNVKIKLIDDGDVSGALLVSNDKFNVDLFMGIGGGPEGVLVASALDKFNCFFQGRFIFDTEESKKRASKMGIKDLERKYMINEIVRGDSIFCATGITNGDLCDGIKINGNKFLSETFVTHKDSGFSKVLKREFDIKT